MVGYTETSLFYPLVHLYLIPNSGAMHFRVVVIRSVSFDCVHSRVTELRKNTWYEVQGRLL